MDGDQHAPRSGWRRLVFAGVDRRTGWGVAVPMVAVLAGLLFAASRTTSHGIDLRVSGRDDVANLVDRQQQTVLHQTKQLAGLERKVQAATSTAARGDSRVVAAHDQADGAADAAGLQPLTGPGVSVSLNDAPPLPGKQKDSVPPDYLVVHQQDVQAVVNALWAGGAEALTLQGQRVISTSAVLCVGNTLLLQGVVYSPPYVVTAIGDPAQLTAALDAAPDVVIYRQYVQAYGLGYSVTTSAHLKVPAYTGVLTLPDVHPLAPASAGPSTGANS